MSDPKHAGNMLATARKDLRALKGMLDEEIFADEIFGFHVQQAVEKTLKAWVALLGMEFHRRHDLSLLLETLRRAEQDVDPYRELVEFNAFAVQFRYDFFAGADEPLNRVRALQGD